MQNKGLGLHKFIATGGKVAAFRGAIKNAIVNGKKK